MNPQLDTAMHKGSQSQACSHSTAPHLQAARSTALTPQLTTDQTKVTPHRLLWTNKTEALPTVDDTQFSPKPPPLSCVDVASSVGRLSSFCIPTAGVILRSIQNEFMQFNLVLQSFIPLPVTQSDRPLRAFSLLPFTPTPTFKVQ
ncbi:hypothetical protein MHYP_G00133440 [Metynnis hypsauchen]